MTWDGLSPPYSTIVVDPPWPYEDAPMQVFGGDSRLSRYLGYSTMSLGDIGSLGVGALGAPGAHVYLWTTQRFLWDARAIIEGWGCRLLAVLTWCKRPIGLGGGTAFASTTEFVLFGRHSIGRLLQMHRECQGLTRGDVHRAVRGGKPTGIVYRWEANDCFPTPEDWSKLVDLLDLPPVLAAEPNRTDSTWWQWDRGPHSTKPPAFFDIVEQVSPAPYVELFARQPRLGWDAWGHGYESDAIKDPAGVTRRGPDATAGTAAESTG